MNSIRTIMYVFTLLSLVPWEARAKDLYNIQIKYEVVGGAGFTAPYVVITNAKFIYSNINIANKNTFSSIKLPLRGGSGCIKGFIHKAIEGMIGTVSSVNSLCVKVDREFENVYYVRETRSAVFPDSSSSNDYASYHLYLDGKPCSVNVDAAWRTFKNIPGRQFPATKLVMSDCQIPGPTFFQDPSKP